MVTLKQKITFFCEFDSVKKTARAIGPQIENNSIQNNEYVVFAKTEDEAKIKLAKIIGEGKFTNHKR